MRQRHFLIILGVALVFFIQSFSLASNSDDQCDYMAPPEPGELFSWDGEVNPNKFDEWELLGIQRISHPYRIWAFHRNPDEASAIEIVALLVQGPEAVLLGYRYFKEGNPYGFRFNPENAKYEEYHFTEEERKGCMQCHQDKLIARESI